MQKSETLGVPRVDDALTDLMRNGQVENVFPTPIFYHVIKNCDALNDGLRRLILGRERDVPSTSKSNIGGWQSQPDFFDWEAPEVGSLLRFVQSALDIATLRVTAPKCVRMTFDVFGWAAVNRSGHYNTAHLHPGAVWSGVYYVDPGDLGADSEAGGQLEFINPVSAAAMTFFADVLAPARLVEPKPGLIILFPSYLLHSVRLYTGERPRVCIPFNAHIKTPVRQ